MMCVEFYDRLYVMKHLSLMLIALALTACSSWTPPCAPPASGDLIYVVGQGWHAEIGIPVEELTGDMAFYRDVFPGARVIIFGYGKKTFFTAHAAVIQAFAINVTPVEAYPPEDTVVLRLPPGGSRALSAYIWQDLIKDASGKPKIVAPSSAPAGLFYAAQSEYNLFHTCNTWAAEALHAAGLPISGDDVIFSGQVMTQIDAVAENQCR